MGYHIFKWSITSSNKQYLQSKFQTYVEGLECKLAPKFYICKHPSMCWKLLKLNLPENFYTFRLK